MTCGVYEVWCGPYFYQGSSKNIEVRVKSHLRDLRKGKHENPKFQAAYNKHGWSSFAVLIECDEHALARWEQQYLDANFGNENFINLNTEAYRPPHNPEWCAAHSSRMKGRVRGPMPIEVRQNISAAKMGYTHSEETKAKISKANEERVLTDEARERMAASMRGHHYTPEERLARSVALKGRPRSPETRAKIAESMKARAEQKRIGQVP